MTATPPTLYFMCGKMAAGKSTQASALAVEKDAGERQLRFRYTATYVKRGGDWRAFAIPMDKRDPAP